MVFNLRETENAGKTKHNLSGWQVLIRTLTTPKSQSVGIFKKNKIKKNPETNLSHI